LGYKVSYRILDALDYGAPQQRERMIMVGHKLKGTFLFPEPLYGPDSRNNKPHLTAAEALKGLKNDEDLGPLYLKNGKYAHLLPLVPPGDNYLYFTAKRGYARPVFAYRSRFSDFLYKANPNSPIKTLIASPGKYTGPFHWDSRRFTVAEYKRLQGFPGGYSFAGMREDAVKQIGNSVSPKFSYWLAVAIAQQIFDRDVQIALLPEDQTLSFDKRKGQKAQNTRKYHASVVLSQPQRTKSFFTFKDYTTHTTPTTSQAADRNTTVSSDGNKVQITLRTDGSKELFAKMNLEIFSGQQPPSRADKADAFLEIIGYGESEFTIQSMWNAVDNWVTKSSNFHSLFELYGHFTEPHPIFQVISFKSYTKHPIGEFAKHCADFENCSRYFSRDHLTALFGSSFGKKKFVDLVEILRGYRFDIRCHETNVTMPKDVYMVCYPFTLPYKKQMNFSIKHTREEQDAKKYA
jgi:DNA (cytosine-5)-methyltransferase 1